tara:strand:+ start:1281 stop:2183 length:903 start_codon:yes stop_codon:yes gene_type:complete
MIKNSNFGLMFHHFHNNGNKPSFQGSITPQIFKKIILQIGVKNIINPYDFINGIVNGNLKPGQVCLTFDDALFSQYKYALPIMDNYKLKSFWFIYTSVFEKKSNNFEVYKYFYNNYYNSFNEFFNNFKKKVKDIFPLKKIFFDKHYFKHFKIYSKSEREYRFIRDKILSDYEFNEILNSMIKDKKVNLDYVKKKLYLNSKHVKKLFKEGHAIGLHSHNHPPSFEDLTLQDQKKEYTKCHRMIKKITNSPPISMSHPCNSYNKTTLKILKKMKIKIGFRADNSIQTFSKLELPRIDCKDLL